jgi:type I restriction enzyme S subunit
LDKVQRADCHPASLLEGSGGGPDTPVGRVAYFDGKVHTQPAACSNFFKTLRPAREQVHPRFLLRKLAWFYRQAPILALQQQTTGIVNLKFKEYLASPISIPSTVGEQAKLAEILDTLDTAIQETEAIIAKLKAVKQGLLHDLLTRGIDDNGELRPPQAEAPHLYKQSALGWIPEEWQIKPLSHYTSSEITYGIVQAGPHVPGGVPYIRTGDMSGDSLNRESMLCTSQRIASSYARSRINAGDLVMAIRATVGKVLPVPPELDGANLTQGTARISPTADTDGAFLLWAIRHARAQTAIQLEVKGTTFAEITLAALRQVPLAAPASKAEQFEIGRRMAVLDQRISIELDSLAKRRSQKAGLMDDLLTGRVRVTPLLEPASP